MTSTVVTSPRFRRAALALCAVLALAGCSDEPEREEATGELEESGDVDVFEVQVGDCLGGETAEGEISSVEATPCTEPHAEEIFASVTVADGEYPGQEALDAEAEKCVAEFAEFVGMAYDESVLEINYMTPTEDSWAQDDREILCTIYDPAGETTGSLAGANR